MSESSWCHGVAFEIDGRELTRAALKASERAPISIRIGRRRTPSATGFIERHLLSSADREGIAISTFGKVIKRGWDWLGVTPPPRVHIRGLIEVPDLAACLTLSKNDFIRTGERGASYLAYRKAIQEVVSRHLAAWGDARHAEARPRTARLERDLERVLEDLAEDFPLLQSLIERRGGGQKRLPMAGRGDERVPAPLLANVTAGGAAAEESALPRAGGATAKQPQGISSPRPEPESPPRSPGEAPPSGHQVPETEAAGGPLHADGAASASALGTVAGRRRPARYGLLVQCESRPDDSELARLMDSTIWINDAHPAFTRAMASRSLGYHTAVAVAPALAPLAVEPHAEHSFVTKFLAYWGSAQVTTRRTGRRRAKWSA